MSVIPTHHPTIHGRVPAVTHRLPVELPEEHRVGFYALRARLAVAVAQALVGVALGYDDLVLGQRFVGIGAEVAGIFRSERVPPRSSLVFELGLGFRSPARFEERRGNRLGGGV